MYSYNFLVEVVLCAKVSFSLVEVVLCAQISRTISLVCMCTLCQTYCGYCDLIIIIIVTTPLV